MSRPASARTRQSAVARREGIGFEPARPVPVVGGPVELASSTLLSPVLPGKIVGIGRNYVEHARELGNAMPEEPLLFLKAPSAVVGPREPVVLPPESGRVEHEGESPGCWAGACVAPDRTKRGGRSWA